MECMETYEVYIGQLMNLKHEVEEKGIDGFQKYYMNSSIYEKCGIQLLMQGFSVDTISLTMDTALKTLDINASTFIKYKIFQMFLVSLRTVTSDREMMVRLSSCLGPEYLLSILED